MNVQGSTIGHELTNKHAGNDQVDVVEERLASKHHLEGDVNVEVLATATRIQLLVSVNTNCKS